MTVEPRPITDALLQNPEQEKIFRSLNDFALELSGVHDVAVEDYIQGAASQVLIFALYHDRCGLALSVISAVLSEIESRRSKEHDQTGEVSESYSDGGFH